ncbi:phenylalanine--tRNA ligase subunit beta [Actinomyces minihominis]|uniref:phenylalanine--tRNA ligase subunit beta n=1 Tax=Actinomyces minihominis TaxID=2002838 RepID=UPI000C06998F|nr:phenylalanine--tRNA ligase subunit beta [Actinomyces minihominis]
MPYISLSWLADHVEVPEGATTEELAADLVKVGIEEEAILPAAVVGPLVAGKVLSVQTERQSNGKDINYCRVDVGQFNDEPGTGAEKSHLASRGIICGAHNFTEGDTVVVALPGAILPGPFPISARKTYGHTSDGMICSERELGLGNDHDGIIVVDKMMTESLPTPGTDMIPLLGLGEEVLEVNVTPDRGYCFAVRGLAREYAHSTGAKFHDLGSVEALRTPLPTSEEGAFKVEVAADSILEGRPAADRFVTRIVRGIDPNAKSPDWMVKRLEQAGMRSIGLAVDVTNYVMLDLGQPLHAYDIRAVEAPFVVRRAVEGEKFTTLDEVERELDEGDIVISDSPNGPGSRIVGLAGVMGGQDSEVQGDTTDLVIEAAHFDSISIARTSRRHRLFTESSKRFERGVDPELAPIAAARVAELLAEYGGGVVDDSGFDLNAVVRPAPLQMKASEPRRLTGVDYTPEQIVGYLEDIGCEVEFDEVIGEGGSTSFEFLVTPPTWRPDLTGAAHLVEEIARLDGYDKIPSRIAMGPGSQGLSVRQLVRRRAADTLANTGLAEVKSYPFVGNAHDRQGIPDDDMRRKAVRLRNPLANDAPLLRTSLLDTTLDIAARNAARGVSDLALFEMGQVTNPQGTVPSPILGVEDRPSDDELAALLAGVPSQPWHAAAVVGGPFASRSGAQLEEGAPLQAHWGWSDAIQVAREIGETSGVRVEATRTWLPEGTKVLRGAPLPKQAESPEETAPFHPGRCATLFVRSGKGFKVVGRAGELHPAVIEEYGLPPRSAAMEINLDEIAALTKSGFIQAKPVSTYPPVKEDLAVIVEDYITEGDVANVIRRAAAPLLETLTLFDIYRGTQIPDGSRSLAYSLTLRAQDRTLKPEEVTEVRAKIIADLEKRLKASVRTGA